MPFASKSTLIAYLGAFSLPLQLAVQFWRQHDRALCSCHLQLQHGRERLLFFLKGMCVGVCYLIEEGGEGKRPRFWQPSWRAAAPLAKSISRADGPIRSRLNDRLQRFARHPSLLGAPGACTLMGMFAMLC